MEGAEMKLANILVERFREIEVNSKGKLYGHRLEETMREAWALAARIDRDGEDIVYLFPDRSRLKVINPMQVSDKAKFSVLSNVG